MPRVNLIRTPLSSTCLFAAAALTGGLLATAPAQAQDFGFGTLPSFSVWGPSLESGGRKWDGQYVRASTGFTVTKFRHGPTVAGPTASIEAGRMWREGNLVWGIAAAGSYEPARASWRSPTSGLFESYNRDLTGAVRGKIGVLANENLLFYTSVGAVAGRETWRGAAPFGSFANTNFSRDDIRVRPDIRAGVEWAVTPNLTLGLEVGVVPPVR
jgi:outer membrane immunogenic protein